MGTFRKSTSVFDPQIDQIDFSVDKPQCQNQLIIKMTDSQ